MVKLKLKIPHIHGPKNLPLPKRLGGKGLKKTWSKNKASAKSEDGIDIKLPPTDASQIGPPPTGPAPAACSICQEPVGLPTPDGITEMWAALPCGHRFGSACIKTWLSISWLGMTDPSCPICRLPMVHACKHPVLPHVLGPRTDTASSSRSGSSHDSCCSSTSPTPPTNIDASSPPAIIYKPRQWRGRPLGSMCKFCTVQRHKLPLRIFVRILRMIIRLRTGRRRRRVTDTWATTGPDGLDEEDHDPWRRAFQAWYEIQEPRILPPSPPPPPVTVAVADHRPPIPSMNNAPQIPVVVPPPVTVAVVEDRPLTPSMNNPPHIPLMVLPLATGVIVGDRPHSPYLNNPPQIQLAA